MALVFDDEKKPARGGRLVFDDAPQAPSGGATAADWLKTADSALGQGVLGILGGVGQFVQAPGSNLNAGFQGAAALLNRGVSSLTGGLVPLNQELQQQAQDASAAAAAQRATNVNMADESAAAWLNPRTALARLGVGLQEDARSRIQGIRESDQATNPELIRQQRALDDAEGFVGNLGAIVDNPMGFSHTLMRSLPDMALGLGVARRVAGATLAGAATPEAAAALMPTAVARASAAGLGMEAASSAAQGRESVYQEVMELPPQVIARSEHWPRALQAAGGDAFKAREILANELADQASLASAMGTAAGGRIARRAFGGDTTAEMLAGRAVTGRQVLKNIGEEGFEEAAQGLPEDLVQYTAGVQANPDKELDLGGSLAQNLAAGAAMGAGGSTIAYGRSKLSDAAGTAPGAPPAAPGSPGAPGAPVNAGDLIDEVAPPVNAAAPATAAGMSESQGDTKPPGAAAPNQGQIGGAPVAESLAPGRSADGEAGVAPGSAPTDPEPSDAEAALFTPRPITGLDRVQEIDQQVQSALADAPPVVNPITGTEVQPTDPGYAEVVAAQGDAAPPAAREALASAEALRAERAALAENWPTVQAGQATSFTTEAGARVDGQYALAEADDLQASHDADLRPNPVYPAELQPRDRTRAASEAQVAGIVARLDPARLGLSATAADGAPIIGADGLVESGNARTIALKRVYDASGQAAEGYKGWLRQNAPQFGLTPEQVDNMSRPVLVRVRKTPVNRAEFARQANASTVAQMSPLETARADAARIDAMDDLQPNEQGDFATSRDFIRRFVGRLPATERGAMMDANGRLSSGGYARVRNAVLAKAYGDSPVLTRMVESLDDNMRNVTKALMIAAPRVAQARSAVQAGRLFDADVTPHLVAAVEEIGNLKDSGTSLADALSQMDIEGDRLSPETREFMQFLSDNVRRPRRIADFITNYFDALDSMGDPAQGSLMGEVTPPTTGELMAAARATTEGNQRGTAVGIAQDDQRGVAGEAAQGGAGAAVQSEAAPSGGGSTQADAIAATVAASQAAANDPQGPKWLAFPPQARSLGIPRAEMPQVRAADRPEMLQFLAQKGIASQVAEVDPTQMRPSQVEFSPPKVESAKGIVDDEKSMAIVSTDGFVIDGHHRWMAQAAKGEPLRAIQLEGKAADILKAIHQFPKSRRSDESKGAELGDVRALAVRDLKDGFAALGDALTKYQRAAMVPEDAPGVMPALTQIADAAIRIVGADIKRLSQWVREAMRLAPDKVAPQLRDALDRLRPLQGKISGAMIRKAAERALKQRAGDAASDVQLGLFPDMAPAEVLSQGDLFMEPEAGQQVQQLPAPTAPDKKAAPKNKGAANQAQPQPAADLFGETRKPKKAPEPDLFSTSLIVADNAPPKDRPIVLVFGGSFNPVHRGHVLAAESARRELIDAGYTVEKVIVSPSPQRLLQAKSGAEANELVDRAAMAREAFKDSPWAEVVEEPSVLAAAIEGKLKRTQQADWARQKFPGASVVSLTGQDAAPGSPPGFPSLYQGDPGTSHEGYYYLAVPRDESSADNISSSKIRKLVEAGEAVPADWETSGVVRYFKALKGLSNETAIDGKLYDLDAPHFGLPLPARPLPDGHPLLQDTLGKQDYEEVDGDGTVHRGTRAQLRDKIEAEFFSNVDKPDPGQRPVVVVMGGGGAAGKGTILRMLRSRGEIMPPHQAVHLDPDKIKEKIPEYEALLKAGDTRAAGVVHEESSALNKRIEERARRERYNVILDVTLGNPTKALAKLREYKEAGYEIRLIGVTIDPATAVVRAIKRATEPGPDSGRWVPVNELLKAHKAFTPAWGSYAELADVAVLYDNSNGARVKIAEKKLGEDVRIDDQGAYNRVVERSTRVNENADTIRQVRGGLPGVQQGGRELARPGEGAGRPQVSGGPVDGQAGPRDDARGGQAEGRMGGDGRQAGARNPEAGQAVGGQDGDARSAGRNDPAQAQGPGGAEPGQVRGGPRGRNQDGGRPAGDGAAAQGEVGQARPDGGRAADELGDRDERRGAAGRGAGVPAGPDIPAKSGLNFRFTPADLTYEGSWFQKARRNVDAVELLKKLQAEGRQATPDEQRQLAQFNGWGATEIANNIFDAKKIAAARSGAELLKYLQDNAEEFDKRGGMPSSSSRYWEVYNRLAEVLRKEGIRYYDTIPSRFLTAKNLGADSSAARWVELHDRLKAAMTKEEWAEASRTTQYAHYTSAGIVRSMWAALSRFGFKGGTVLEPGAGNGIFPGLMPADMAVNSAYTGIEYDSITGGVLKQLQPDERILVESYIDSKLPRNFYDVAIGNPPFAGFPVLADPEYAKFGFKLHDYFFAKTVDRVKPGGLVMFITSRYTMDKLDDKARKYMAERADLIGAIRLPQTAFKANAGTEVVTDVLFLRKKVPGETFEGAQAWGKSVPMKVGEGTFPVNEYFHANPDMVLGSHSDTGKMQNSRDPQYTVTPPEGDIEALFAAAVERLPADVYKPQRGSAAEAAKVRDIDFNPRAQKEGNYYVNERGVLMQREAGVGQAVIGKKPAEVEVIKAFVPLRDALKQAQYDQLNGGNWQASLAALQAEYRKFVDARGRLNQFTTRNVRVKVDELDDDGEPTGNTAWDTEERRHYTLHSILNDDPDSTLVMALESVDDNTGAITESKFLTERVLDVPARPKVETAHDALLATLNEVGRVDLAEIAQRLDMSESDVIDSLGSAVYQDPEAGWVMADDYLTGNVKAKLDAARAAARSDRRYERNVKALESVQPAPKSPSQINAALGMSWIPESDYEQFVRELTGANVKVNWNAAVKQWSVEAAAIETHQIVNSWGRVHKSYTTQAGAERELAKLNEGRDADRRYTMRAIDTAAVKARIEVWGTERMPLPDLVERALSGAPIDIRKEVGTGDDVKSVRDVDAIEAANERLKKLREAFSEWIWKDAERTDRLTRQYNDTYNTHVQRQFDGRHLSLPGTSTQFSIFDHVKRGAWRIIQTGNTYLAHAVGSGKTFQMVISAMEQKRLGLIKKPMMVVPNHMLKQFASEWQALYPAARLMVADETQFHTDNRRRWVSRVALSDLDGVIITHSAFKLLDLDPAFKRKIIEEQLEQMRAAYQAEGGDVGSLRMEGGKLKGGVGPRGDMKVKQIERAIERMEQRLLKAMTAGKKDQNARFDELGVDMLYVDEAHEFRKLDFTTNRQVKGLSPQGSERSLDLYTKVRWLEDRTPGRSLVMASGTPVTNTLAELYTVQKFLGHQALKEKGVEDFDSWAAMFGRERTELEPNAAGAYEPVTRFQNFVNVSGLTQMFRDFADVVTADELADMLGDKRPKVEGGSRKMVITPKTGAYKEYQAELSARMEASRAWRPSKDEPNNPDPIIKIIGDGRLAAIDMRFVNPKLPSDPDSKLNRLADDVVRTFRETADMEFADKQGVVEPNKGATMMVFADIGFGAGVAESRGFNARAWLEKRLRDGGVPMAQVAFMSDYKNSADKLKLFRDVNAGRVRVLIGSSKNMGTGVNAQQRLKALFHLDSPWYPSDIEQREGRIVRQGNKNKLVQLYAYAMKGSYDEAMWKMLASKQHFINQALSGDQTIDEVEDLDSQSQFDIAAGMVADDPRVLELAGKKAEIEKLHRLFRAHEDQRQRKRERFGRARQDIEFAESMLPEAEASAASVPDITGDKFRARVGDKVYTERAEWGRALTARWKELSDALQPSQTMGEVGGFKVRFVSRQTSTSYQSSVVLKTPQERMLLNSADVNPVGVAMQAQNGLADVMRTPARLRDVISQARDTMDSVRESMNAPFPMAEMLSTLQAEARALEAAIAAGGGDTYWVERVGGDGAGFEVRADSPAEAVQKIVKSHGGTTADWRAIQRSGVTDEDLADQAIAAVAGMIPPPPYLSRGASGSSGGMSMRELRAVAADVQRRMPGLPPVRVLESPAQAPEALRRFIEGRGAMGDVEGALFDGRIYLFQSGLSDAQRAEFVLAEHEAAHAGLRGLLGPRGTVTAMQALYNQNAALRRRVAPLLADGMSVAEAVEEVIVDIPSAQLARLTGWRGFVERMRDALKTRGFRRMAAWLDNLLAGHTTQQQRADLAVANLVREARAFVRRPGRPAAAGMALSAGSLADDLAAQEQWLTEQAKKAGHADIEAMLEADYPLFEKLAEQWRADHPVEGDARLSRAWHGTHAKNIKRFDVAHIGSGEGGSKYGWGLYFATKREVAAHYRPTDWEVESVGGEPFDKDNRAHYLASLVASRGGDRQKAAAEMRRRGFQGRDVIDLEDESIDLKPAKMKAAGAIYEVELAPTDNELLLWDKPFDKQSPLVQEALTKLVKTADEQVQKAWAEALVKGLLTGKRAYFLLGSSETPNLGGENGQLTSKAMLAAGIRGNKFVDADSLRLPEDQQTHNYVIFSNDDVEIISRMSRAAAAAPAEPTAAERAEAIIQQAASTPRPLDAAARALTRVTGLERFTTMLYGQGGRLLDRMVPERVKAGVVSDYGIPEAVIDHRARMQGTQREQLRQAGKLVEKLATLTRAESRVAYEWMNAEDTRTADELMKELPEESVKVLLDVRTMIDQLSQEAVRLGQLDAEAFKRHRFAYLRRSYFKHEKLDAPDSAMTKSERAGKVSALTILGDQYKGRGMVAKAAMKQVENVAPQWWKRKLEAGKADTALKGEKFVRLEWRTMEYRGTVLRVIARGKRKGEVLRFHNREWRPVDASTLEMFPTEERQRTKLEKVVYWPAGEPLPAAYADWDNAGTWEVRGVKGADLIVWRDFTKDERIKMGEIDEARYAIGKTLHRMIHDVEVGRYLEWLGQNYAKLPGEVIPGTVVEASERYRDTFKPGEWVQVPDVSISGTSVKKYGKLAGMYLPGPIWNDLRQVVNQQRIGPEWWQTMLRWWKTSKTALSPGVHTNNIMSNFVMADWHDVSAGHVHKALRIILAARSGDGKGALGAAANLAGKVMSIADREAAREIVSRYENSGGSIGGWVTAEIAREQLAPVIEALSKELNATLAQSMPAEIGVYSALQHLMYGRFPQAWGAFKASRPASVVATDGGNLIDLYQAEDDVFRLAAWLKAKEEGMDDGAAGKVSRKSFLDYSINAPWVAAARATVLPFISFTYRAVPMLIETAAKRPHKIMKLAAIVGTLNALGVMLAGGDDDDERKLLPEEKAGRVWGMVPKLVRMPWNDAHGSPVYLDIRRWVPVGDVLDLGQGHAALPIPPSLMPGGPAAVFAEVVFNRSMFTGKAITLETDTGSERLGKVLDHLWKAAMPNIIGVPNTYATEGVAGALSGRTDAFGRELSPAQAVLSAGGVKLGSYPADVLRRNIIAKREAQVSEIDKQIAQLRRQRQTNRIDQDEFEDAVRSQQEKKAKLMREVAEKMN